MAPPLGKRKRDGSPYRRPASVEAAIDRALAADLATIVADARSDDREHPRYDESECLLHLIRSTRLDNSDSRFRELFGILVGRVERSLRGSIRASAAYDAQELRQTALDDFVDLIIDDRASPGTRLDYFEVRFASALAALRIDVVRSSRRETAVLTPLSQDGEEDGEDLPLLADRLRAEFQAGGAEQEREHFRNDLLRAIDSLPPGQREVVALVLAGHRVEDKDEGAVTIPELCGVGDRAVRYRLTKACEALRRKLGEAP